MTPYQYVKQQGYFLDESNLRIAKGGPSFRRVFFDPDYRALSFLSFFTNDQNIEMKLSDVPFYEGQSPIRVNHIGANSSNDIICYLNYDWEGKAEYEKNLLTEATKEHAETKTTSKRRM